MSVLDSMFIDSFAKSQPLHIILVLCVLAFLCQWSGPSYALKKLHWVGESQAPFSRLLGNLRSLRHGRAFLEESYYKYGKANQPCVLPGIYGHQVVLPPSMVPWLVDQPESILSAGHAQFDQIESKYTTSASDGVLLEIREAILRRDMKIHLNELIPDIQDEISHAVDEVWGTETESFVSVNVDRTIREIVARVSNRVFVGLPLCRDPFFVDNVIKYVDIVLASGMFLKLLPRLLRPFIAKVAVLGNRLYYSRCVRYLEPFFAKRISAWHHSSSNMLKTFADWSVCEIGKDGNPINMAPDMLSRRTMTLNFAAIHTSTMTIANLIMDIISKPAGEECLNAISMEYEALDQKYGDQWTSARVAEMSVVDSALRESMRLSGFAGKAFRRKVVAKEGVTVPGGTYIPHNETVCTSGYSLHHDENIYADPYSFRYDRFLQPVVDGPKTSAASTGVNYAVWGHGMHACPGRFFAVTMIKMMVGYMVEKYELKLWDERPANVWIGDTPIPSRGTKIEFRRRQGHSA